MANGLRTLAWMGALLASGAHAAAGSGALERRFWTWVALDEEGRVAKAEVEDRSSKAMAAVVQGLSKELTFAPATAGGQPVASEVPVELGVRFTPDDADNYEAAVRWARVHELRTKTSVPAVYPAAELRAGIGGWALVGFVVDGDGEVDARTVQVLDQGAWRDRRLLGADHAAARAFAESARGNAVQGTFRPARVGGAPVVVRIAVPTTFQARADQAEDPTELPVFVLDARRPAPAPQLQQDDITMPVLATNLPESPPDLEDNLIDMTGSRIPRTIVR